MNRLIMVSSVVLIVLFTAIAGSADPSSPGERPAATPGTRLLLPLYTVDTLDPDGTTTLFAVRNQTSSTAILDIRYFRTDRPQAPQLTDVVGLGPKAVTSFNIAFVTGLAVDADGMARGYVVIESITGIQGDFFQVTPNQDYATGSRLVNIDPASSHNELCNLFTARFLNGGGFDSATRYLIWRDLALPPSPGDAAFAVAVYNEAGELLLVREIASDQVAFEISSDTILQPLVSAEFGVFEFQFFDATVGHISAVMSASGRYSVGLEASCGDAE